MTLTAALSIAWIVLEYGIKLAAIGIVPENRRPSSSMAWLLIILLVPVVGLPLFFLLGSPYINRRRHRIQAAANASLEEGLEHLPTIPPGAAVPPGVATLLELDRHLTRLPCVTGRNHGLRQEALGAMVAAVEGARHEVDVEIYITAWDETTEVFFAALTRAVERGVTVRLLLDHLGSHKYPGFGRLGRRLDAAGIRWRYMLPLQPLRGRFRRIDLRNHRKLVVVDGRRAFMGSANLIDPSYLKRANVRAGRRWHDVMVEVSGDVVAEIRSVFEVDWYTETGERLTEDFPELAPVPVEGPGGDGNYMQLVPSGPGFSTEPNLRLFTSLIHLAQRRVDICSPYFVPDESLLAAVTTAGYRGVEVVLYVSEQADQFMVDHAQSSYYGALLEAGVRIVRYPRPAVLHTKFLVVDDTVGVLGSSNMDMRSFGLNYEISLLTFGGDLVGDLVDLAAEYRARSVELTAAQWRERPWHQRYLDSVFRLTSALQ